MVYAWFSSALSSSSVIFALTVIKPHPDGRVRLLWESTASTALRGTDVHWAAGLEDTFVDTNGEEISVPELARLAQAASCKQTLPSSPLTFANVVKMNKNDQPRPCASPERVISPTFQTSPSEKMVLDADDELAKDIHGSLPPVSLLVSLDKTVHHFDFTNQYVHVDAKHKTPYLVTAPDGTLLVTPPLSELNGCDNNEVGVYGPTGRLMGVQKGNQPIQVPRFDTFWPLSIDTGIKSHIDMLMEKAVRWATRDELMTIVRNDNVDLRNLTRKEEDEVIDNFFDKVSDHVQEDRQMESQREWSRQLDLYFGKPHLIK